MTGSCGWTAGILAVLHFQTMVICWPVGDLVCNSPESGQLVTGASTSPYNSIVLPQTASPMDGFYTGYKITITAGQGRYSKVCSPTSQVNCAVESIILNYVGATRTATVAFQGPTAAGDSYVIQRGCYEQPYGGLGSKVAGGSGTGGGTQNITLRWRKLVNNGEIVGRPATTTLGEVIVGTTQGTLAKYSPDGTQMWSIFCGALMAGPVIGPDGIIYLAGGDRKVSAVNGDGTLKWSYALPTPLVASPTYQEETTTWDGADVPAGIIVGDLQGNVTKFLLDGSVAWTFSAGREMRAGAGLLRDGKVVIGSTNGNVYGLDGRSGAVAWTYAAGQEVASKPLVQDVNIIIGTRQDVNPGRLVALSLGGAVRWELNVTSSIESEPIYDPVTGWIYASSSDGKIWAVGADGVLRWRYVTGGAGGVCGNNDVLPDTKATPTTNANCNFAELRVQGATSPTLCAGTLVTTSQNKMVIGLGPANGELRWKYQTDRRIRSPARCWEQRDAFGHLTATVYTGSNDRYLYSLAIPTPAT